MQDMWECQCTKEEEISLQGGAVIGTNVCICPALTQSLFSSNLCISCLYIYLYIYSYTYIGANKNF